ncbi:MAG: hypothetical protein JWM74_4322 [Myxococcaceae bacterium]|nr:hypothetical protein [Myxococcaceae bacterium]
MARYRVFKVLPASVFSLAALSLGAFAACGGDDATGLPTTTLDGGGTSDGGDIDSGDDDATTGDGGGGTDAKTDSPSNKDTIPPGQITLVATPESVTSIKLSWTAVGDDGTTGTAAGYEIRRSLTPITNLTEFNAATLVSSPPAPAASGTPQEIVVTGLTAATTYHFSMRARDEVPNQGPISADASAITVPRATLQITEVAVSNAAAEGYDFVELVAVTPGRLDGLVVRESSGGLYTFGPLAVVAGDRIVVHASGACVPADAGATCQNEDVAGMTATSSGEPFATAAWDVYSTSNGIAASDNVVSLRDGNTIVDAVALSSRDGDTSASNMTAFAALMTANQWTFAAAPVDGTNDCATEKDTASVATNVTACGGQPTAAGGISLQRNGTTDTNGKKDFYAAPQTRGLANGANPAPTVVSVASASATTVKVVLNEDIAAASVVTSAFTIPGLAVSAATLSDVNELTVTTASQTAGQAYTLNMDPGVTDLQGTPGGAGARGFCGFSPTPVALVINEVAPNITGSKDLVELRVTSGGAVAGITLRANAGATGGGTLLGTLPNVCAAAGDLFVVHLTPGAETGESETSSKAEFATVPTYPGNYDGAWDVKGTNNGVVFGETVLSLFTVDPPGIANATILDAVPFTNQNTAVCAPATTCAATAAAFKTALDVIENATQWTPACGGGAPPASACNDTTAPIAVVVSASYMGSTGSVTTAARKNVDTNAAADWAVGAASLGSANP